MQVRPKELHLRPKSSIGEKFGFGTPSFSSVRATSTR